MKVYLVRAVGALFLTAGVLLFFMDDIKGYFMEESNTKVEECYLTGDCSDVSYSNLEAKTLTQGLSLEDSSESEESTEPTDVEDKATEDKDLEGLGEEVVEGSESFSELIKNTPVDQDLVGMFYADKIGLVEPIYLGASHLNLARGLGLVGETDLDSANVPIAGHRVEGVGIRFNEISLLDIGDSLSIKKNVEGKVEEVNYEISDITKVSPTDISVLSQDTGSDKQELTLITCDDYNPETGIWETRLIYKAVEV